MRSRAPGLYNQTELYRNQLTDQLEANPTATVTVGEVLAELKQRLEVVDEDMRKDRDSDFRFYILNKALREEDKQALNEIYKELTPRIGEEGVDLFAVLATRVSEEFPYTKPILEINGILSSRE